MPFCRAQSIQVMVSKVLLVGGLAVASGAFTGGAAKKPVKKAPVKKAAAKNQGFFSTGVAPKKADVKKSKAAISTAKSAQTYIDVITSMNVDVHPFPAAVVHHHSNSKVDSPRTSTHFAVFTTGARQNLS